MWQNLMVRNTGRASGEADGQFTPSELAALLPKLSKSWPLPQSGRYALPGQQIKTFRKTTC